MAERRGCRLDRGHDCRIEGETKPELKKTETDFCKVCNVTDFGDGSSFKLLSNVAFSSRTGKQLSFASGSTTWNEDSISLRLHCVFVSFLALMCFCSRFSASPVLVCKQPVQTVGAGDAISSSALMKSLVTSSE